MNCSCFNVNTVGIPMCAQLPVTYNHWEWPEDDWITVETCSPIVISENKCCADVSNWSIYMSQHFVMPLYKLVYKSFGFFCVIGGTGANVPTLLRHCYFFIVRMFYIIPFQHTEHLSLPTTILWASAYIISWLLKYGVVTCFSVAPGAVPVTFALRGRWSPLILSLPFPFLSLSPYLDSPSGHLLLCLLGSWSGRHVVSGSVR